MPRHALTDEQWGLIEDAFPPPKGVGRPPRDRRQVFEAILWILRTGAPWRDLPEEFGPWQTAWHRFNEWNANGTLDRILMQLKESHLEAGELDDELWCVDGTSVRAARCAAGATSKGAASPTITR